MPFDCWISRQSAFAVLPTSPTRSTPTLEMRLLPVTLNSSLSLPRSSGGQLVAGGEVVELAREAQRRLEAARVDLLAGLAESHLARRQPDQAAAYFEEALRRDPGRDDLRRRLEGATLG